MRAQGNAVGLCTKGDDGWVKSALAEPGPSSPLLSLIPLPLTCLPAPQSRTESDLSEPAAMAIGDRYEAAHVKHVRCWGPGTAQA
eukprot:scaffold1670_cov108-Isochrysis_galbana.AAC.1